jgi:hypothetical protein
MPDRKSKAKKRKPLAVVVRPLDPSDPRSLDHPCHKQQWLELAGAIGRSMADKEYDSQEAKNEKKPND